MFTSLRTRRRNAARITQVVTIENDWTGDIRQQVTTRNQARRAAPPKRTRKAKMTGVGHVLGGRHIGRENSRLLNPQVATRRARRSAVPASPPSEEPTGQIDPAEFAVKALRIGGREVAAYQMADLAGNVVDAGKFHSLDDVRCNTPYQEPIRDYNAANGVQFKEVTYQRHRWLL